MRHNAVRRCHMHRDRALHPGIWSMRAWELAERFGFSFGCGDSCIFGQRGGQHTNGGCRCIPRGMSARNITDDEIQSMRTMIRSMAALIAAVAKELPDDFKK